MDRYVRAGSKAIYILAPLLTKTKKEDGEHEQLFGFKTVYVLDISQTDCKPLPQLGVVRGNPGLALKRLHLYAEQQGITVKRSEGLKTAQGVSMGGTIVLKYGLEAGEEFGTLVHEICHEKLHTQDERTTIARNVLEVEAEAVSFVFAQLLGLTLTAPVPTTSSAGRAIPSFSGLHLIGFRRSHRQSWRRFYEAVSR